MNHYFFYRMTCDSGNAPCVFEVQNGKYYNYTADLLTLACCKGGQFRKGNPVHTGLRHYIGSRFDSIYKNDNVFVIGILKDRIVYIAQITQVLRMEEYFTTDAYQKRQDCIYRYSPYTNNGANWKFIRKDNFNTRFHSKDVNGPTNQHNRDELGDYVLLSNNFMYAGCNPNISIDKIRKFMPTHQETKHYCDEKSPDCDNKAPQIIIDFVTEILNHSTSSNIPTERLDNDSCSKKACEQK